MKKFLVALGLATVLSIPSAFAYTFYVEPDDKRLKLQQEGETI